MQACVFQGHVPRKLGTCPRKVLRRSARAGRADESAENCRAERHPSGAAIMVLDMAHHDMVSGRRRGTVSAMPGCGLRRAGGDGKSCEKDRNCLDGLVHVTPAFLAYCIKTGG